MHSAIIVVDLNGRIFQWLDRFGPLLTRSGGKPRRWPPTAFPKRTLRACSASPSRPCASIAVPSSHRAPVRSLGEHSVFSDQMRFVCRLGIVLGNLPPDKP